MLPKSYPPPPDADNFLHDKPKRSPSSPLSPDSSRELSPKCDASVLSAIYLQIRIRHRIALFIAFIVLQLIVVVALSAGPQLLKISQLLRREAGYPPLMFLDGASDSHCTDLIYVYDLPPAFNSDLLAACDELTPWASFCEALSNAGFGPSAAKELAGVVAKEFLPSWYTTDQFALEVIFHRRALAHPCRTLDPRAAYAFYVPFYVGLSVGRYLWSGNLTARDADCHLFVRWILDQNPWKRSNGEDHFMAVGRITWDFQRVDDGVWGSSFSNMPGMENMTRLLIEPSPWKSNEFGIPYPTFYHPRSAAEVRHWQEFVLGRNRSMLFSFAGSVRTKKKDDFRLLLLNECKRESKRGLCRSAKCAKGSCHRAADPVSLFLHSKFCLQPRGDSPTRRSMFDCMIAGAVPVIFWRETVHNQYKWHLPCNKEEEERDWLVFIDQNAVRNGTVTVKGILKKIGKKKVRKMREKVVEMIPRLVYAAREEGLGEGMKDAFDVALEGVLRRLQDRRRRQAILLK